MDGRDKPGHDGFFAVKRLIVPPLRLNPIPDRGSIQAQFERLSKIGSSIFSPFFRVRRVGLRASHMRCVLTEASGTRFFRDGGGRLLDSLSRSAGGRSGGGERDRGAGIHVREGYPARGRNRDMAVLLSSKNLFFGACRTAAPGNKKARDCGMSAGRAASGRTAGEWVEYAQLASRCQGRNPVQKIKCSGTLGLITSLSHDEGPRAPWRRHRWLRGGVDQHSTKQDEGRPS